MVSVVSRKMCELEELCVFNQPCSSEVVVRLSRSVGEIAVDGLLLSPSALRLAANGLLGDLPPTVERFGDLAPAARGLERAVLTAVGGDPGSSEVGLLLLA